MKKFITVWSVIALCLCLTSCAGGNSGIGLPSPDGGDPIRSQPAAEPSASSEADDPVMPRSTAELSTDPTDPPDDVDLIAFSQTLPDNYSLGITTTDNDTGEVRTSLMILDLDNASDKPVIDNYYAGLTDMTLRQCLVCINNFTTVESELALVQTGDIEDVAAVEDIFQARIDYMVGDGNGPGGAWYPQPTEVWENNSRIVSNGTYIMFVVHPTKCDDIVDDFKALF